MFISKNVRHLAFVANLSLYDVIQTVSRFMVISRPCNTPYAIAIRVPQKIKNPFNLSIFTNL